MTTTLQALHYCEVISTTIQQQPGCYSAQLVRNVYELACRLEYHDPRRLHAGEDYEDPAFITQLARVLQSFDVSDLWVDFEAKLWVHCGLMATGLHGKLESVIEI